MSDPFIFVLRFVLQVAALLFLLRFVLQAVRASFYNPFSEGIVRFTDPVLRPLRSVLPAFRNWDLASFAMAWLAHLVMSTLRFFAFGGGAFDILFIFSDALHGTLNLVVMIFLVAIFVTVIMSWLAPGVYSPASLIAREVAEPLLARVRRLLPPLGGLDLSPMVAILALLLVQSFVLGALLPHYPG